MEPYIAAAVALALKFYVYSIYARKLNAMFGQAHNPYKVSAVRIVFSLLLTGLNAAFFMFYASESIMLSPLPFAMAVIFAVVSWYALLRIFYTQTHNAALWKAVAIGTLISAVMSGIMAFLSFIGIMSTINFC
jgi:hypothetical protein